MTSGKKKRLSMLDSLAAAGATPPPSTPTTNRALRSARQAVEGHSVWELDPNAIDDDRIRDRFDTRDVEDLRDAIETNGQTVPILVRRHPEFEDRYLLVYGRRRLEAIRQSDQVAKIRALIATMDDNAAIRAQVSENMARRDLSFIEKALFARELVDQEFGTQSQVAEVLTVGKSAISMALTVIDTITADLARAIGPAHGIGRPRWEALAQTIRDNQLSVDPLIRLAEDTHNRVALAAVSNPQGAQEDPSVTAFETVALQAGTLPPPPKTRAKSTPSLPKPLELDGVTVGKMRRTAKGLRLDISDDRLVRFFESEGPKVIAELIKRWETR